MTSNYINQVLELFSDIKIHYIRLRFDKTLTPEYQVYLEASPVYAEG